MLDFHNISQSYTDLQQKTDFPQNYLEELFLIGKLTKDKDIEKNIKKILEKNFDKSVLDAFKIRKKLPSPLDEYVKNTIEDIFVAYSLASTYLNIGKMFEIMGFDMLWFNENNYGDSLPVHFTRFDRIKEFTLMDTCQIRYLPLEFKKMVHLQKITFNSLETLPDCLGDFPLLTELELNVFNCKKFPEQLFDCTNLQSLKIAWNDWLSSSNTSLQFPEKGWEKLKNLKSLTIIRFPDKEFPNNFFEMLPNLEEIVIHRSALSHLPESIKYCTKLQKLNINGSSYNFEKIPAEIQYCKELNTIELLGLSGENPVQLPVEIFGLPKLNKLELEVKTLKIQEGNLKKALLKKIAIKFGTEGIWEFFTQNTALFAEHLEELYIYRNVEIIGEEIGKLKNLKKLHIEGNVSMISENIENLEKLEEFLIRKWAFLEKIPKNFKKLSNLKKLFFLNQVYDILPKYPFPLAYLPSSKELEVEIVTQEIDFNFEENHEFKSLLLKSNKLLNFENARKITHLENAQFEHLKQGLDKNIGNLPKSLKKLIIQGEITEIADEIGKLENLEHLEIDVYAQSPELPLEMGYLKKLKICKIENVKVSHWEQILPNFTALHTLEISKLKHQLPQPPISIVALQNLKNLKIDDCKTTPNIGELIGKIKSLENLGIKSMDLSNEDFENLCQLYNLQHLDLYYIKEINILSPKISNLTNLKFFTFGYSKNISEIPEELATLPNLEILHLEHLELQGLPTNFTQFPKLEYLFLNGCFFPNGFPTILNEITSMKKIHTKYAKYQDGKKKRDLIVKNN